MKSNKETTIYDLAGKLNISVATVSRALKDDAVVNKKTKKRIFDLAEQMGYRSNHFARNLRTQRTNAIGVIVPRLNSYFMSTVIAGIESVVNNKGYNLIISQSSESAQKEMACAKTMFNSRVDGVLISLAYDTEDIEHYDSFFKKDVPVIFFDRVPENKAYTCVLIDNKKAGYEATKHLVEQGCKKIAHITSSSKRNVYADRLQGYKQALSDFDIAFNEDYVITGNLGMEAGREAAEKIMKLDPMPEAVFVANDSCAVGCILALQQAGFNIPVDIAFVGFNNDPMAMVVKPNLTTINYPGYQMGEVAALNLINHLNGSASLHSTDSILLRSELIVRGSSNKSGIEVSL